MKSYSEALSADAYDAMTSKRSYRDVLPQEVVRADIMLEMTDEDKEYKMIEH